MGHAFWTENDEPTRRQHGGRGHGRRSGPGGPGSGGHSPWGGPWGGPMGGPPPWVAQLFGPGLGGGPGGPGGRGRRGPRARRGDVRSAILDVLHTAGEPVNGYQVIQQIADRTQGAWKPSPGSVYPTIAQLQDEGLVEDAPTGRKAVQLTDDGRAWVADHTEEMAAVWAPFEEGEDDEAVSVKQVIGQTVGAVVQVMQTGTPEQRERAVQILADTRRRLYGVLAEGPEGLEDEDDESDEQGPAEES